MKAALIGTILTIAALACGTVLAIAGKFTGDAADNVGLVGGVGIILIVMGLLLD